jgi:SAM-dependent methyltransferase
MEKLNNFWDDSLDRYLAIANESRKTVLYPKIQSLVSSLNPSSVLDYGCGDGDLLDIIACSTNAAISAYDPSLSAVRAIRRRLGDRRVTIYQNRIDINRAMYDVVICSLVIMTIPSEAGLKELVANVRKAKSENGIGIFAITHPCFRDEQFSTFVTEYTNKTIFDYFDEGRPFEVTIFDRSSDNKIQFKDYHWSLSKTINTLISADLMIKELIEVPDIDEVGNRCYPPYLIIITE